jgi:uncharacterized protein YdbL (DUF1318 family)
MKFGSYTKRSLLRYVLVVAWFHAMLAAVALATVPSVSVEIESASIALLKESLARRLPALQAHFAAGHVGLTFDGVVAIRDETSREGLVELRKLVADENRDRETLYREIARANGRPDWADELKLIFGERWIARAPSGWWIRDARGNWRKK